MKAKVRLLVLVVLGAVAAGTPASGQEEREQPTVEAARQVSTGVQPDRLYVSPVMAVHPDDPLTMAVGVGDVRNGGCYVHVSRDGGLSWTTSGSLMPPNLPFCVQRNFGSVMGLAFAADGTLHAALSGSSVETGHPNGPVAALHARSTDLGGTWQTTVVAEGRLYRHEDGQTAIDGVEQHGLVSLAVHPTDPSLVYLGWRFRVLNPATAGPVTAVPEQPYLAVSRDGGRSWEEPANLKTALPEGVYGAATPSVVVHTDGTAYAFLRERPAPPATGQPRPKARYFLATSTDAGRTWTSRQIYDGQIFIYQPVPAVDRDGTLHLVWWQAEGATLDVPTQIRYMRSTDRGATWSEQVELTDDDPARRFNQYWPGMSVAPNGRIDVAWHDFRDDPYYVPEGTGPMGLGSTTQHFSNIYATYSTDGGRTWAPNVRVTDRSIYRKVGVTFNNQDIVGPVGMASTDTAAHITWSDSRGSGPFDAEDAYFTRLRFDPLVVGSGDESSPLLWALLGAGITLAVGGMALVLALRAASSRSRPARAAAGR
jgi:hypothetical protein